jgi:hypothetical protein
MRQMLGCAERAVGAKIKARKLAERRKLFMYFTPLKASSRANQSESDAFYLLCARYSITRFPLHPSLTAVDGESIEGNVETAGG